MIKKNFHLLLFTFLLVSQNLFAQLKSPYETSFKREAPLVVGGLGLSNLGLTLVKNKKKLTLAQVNAKNKGDVLFYRRFSA